jgi:hypothetical protein
LLRPCGSADDVRIGFWLDDGYQDGSFEGVGESFEEVGGFDFGSGLPPGGQDFVSYQFDQR